MDLAQEEAERAENMLLHEDEIAARPARTWYVTPPSSTLLECERDYRGSVLIIADFFLSRRSKLSRLIIKSVLTPHDEYNPIPIPILICSASLM